MNFLINFLLMLVFCGSLSINAMFANIAKLMPNFGGEITGKISRKSSINEVTGEKTYIEVFQLPKPEGSVKICEVLRTSDEIVKPTPQKPYSLTLLRTANNCVEITAVLNKEMVALKDESEKDYKWLYAILGYVWVPWGHDATVANKDKTFLNIEKDGKFRGNNRLSLDITRPALHYTIKVPYDADVEVECAGDIHYLQTSSTIMQIKAAHVRHNGGNPKENNSYRRYVEREMNHLNDHWGEKETDPRTVLKTSGTVTIIHQ